MEKINKIQKQLEQKSREELNAVVDGFVFSMEQLKMKYGGDNAYWFIGPEAFGQNAEFSVHGISDFIKVLRKLVEKKYLGNMVDKKSEELIDKLDLF